MPTWDAYVHQLVGLTKQANTVRDKNEIQTQ